MLQEKLFTGVNSPADWQDLSDLEKKHLPIISAPDNVQAGERFEVTVEVGKLLAHPNEPAHFIEFVELYADHAYLARIDFTAQTTFPMVKFCIALCGPITKLHAFARCNIHGVWTSEKDISVAE